MNFDHTRYGLATSDIHITCGFGLLWYRLLFHCYSNGRCGRQTACPCNYICVPITASNDDYNTVLVISLHSLMTAKRTKVCSSLSITSDTDKLPSAGLIEA